VPPSAKRRHPFGLDVCLDVLAPDIAGFQCRFRVVDRPFRLRAASRENPRAPHGADPGGRTPRQRRLRGGFGTAVDGLFRVKMLSQEPERWRQVKRADVGVQYIWRFDESAKPSPAAAARSSHQFLLLHRHGNGCVPLVRLTNFRCQSGREKLSSSLRLTLILPLPQRLASDDGCANACREVFRGKARRS
jgi:hypothetical protein